MIYLDYSANTPVNPRVLEVYCRTEQNFIGNPNSTHCAGQAARQEMDRVTGLIAAQLGVLPEEIIYTSGATEANNLALKGMARAARHVGRHIISTPLEHSSVGATLTALQQQGYEIDLLNIGRDGRIDLEQLEELLRKDTVLVSICGVDSELGTVQPVREIAALVHRCPNCRLHVDATQAVGKTALWLDCGYHELYRPQVLRPQRHWRAVQAQRAGDRTSDERRGQHYHLPQRHPHPGPCRGFAGGAGPCTG